MNVLDRNKMNYDRLDGEMNNVSPPLVSKKAARLFEPVKDLKQLALLLWKNTLLQKRSIISTILEILVPALFVIILLPIRTIVRSDLHPDDTVYDEFTINELPSSLTPPFPSDLHIDQMTARVGLWTFAYAPNNTDLVNGIMKNVGDSLNMNIVGKICCQSKTKQKSRKEFVVSLYFHYVLIRFRE